MWGLILAGFKSGWIKLLLCLIDVVLNVYWDVIIVGFSCCRVY